MAAALVLCLICLAKSRHKTTTGFWQSTSYWENKAIPVKWGSTESHLTRGDERGDPLDKEGSPLITRTKKETRSGLLRV